MKMRKIIISIMNIRILFIFLILSFSFFNIKNKQNDYNKNNCTEYKNKNEYEENNKIKDFHEIIIRFKLNSEEYKLLLKEKAKLINPFN